MAKVIITEQYLEDIADAIRVKNGSQDTYYPFEMADAIEAIGGNPVLQSKTYNVSSAGIATVTADSGYDGLSSVAVSVPSAGNVSATLYKNDLELTVDNDTGVVSVYSNDIGGYIEADNSGWINVNQYSEIPNARVSYEINGSLALPTQSTTTISPSESQQTAVAKGKFTTGVVSVGAISSTYVGSGITRRSSSDLTVSGATVTVPSGYYSSNATKSVTSGSATGPSSLSGSSATITTGTNTITLTKTSVTTTPTVSAGYVSAATASTATVALTASVTVNPTPTASGAIVTIPAGYYSAQTTKSVDTMTLPTSTAASATTGYTSKATISRSTSDQYINIASGYNSAGGYYKISAVANGNATAPSTISGTSATVSTGTNTLTLTKTVSVTPTVSAGYISSGTAGNSSVSLTASVTTKAAATITPTTTNQTIAAGTYLTGTQTIAGDADLVGGNILSTANIFGVQGTVVVQNYYTGSSAPSSSTGSNGDLYLQS